MWRVNNFSERHKNTNKHTNCLEVEILIRNKFMSISEASGKILTKDCEKISFLHNVKKFKTWCVLDDITGMLSHQVLYVGGHKQNTRQEKFNILK
jgi:hypothetical protein